MAKKFIRINDDADTRDLFGECVGVFGVGNTIAAFFQNPGTRDVEGVKDMLREVKRQQINLSAAQQRIEQYIMDNRITEEEAKEYQSYIDDR